MAVLGVATFSIAIILNLGDKELWPEAVDITSYEIVSPCQTSLPVNMNGFKIFFRTTRLLYCGTVCN
jgi:hypothetical protein